MTLGIQSTHVLLLLLVLAVIAAAQPPPAKPINLMKQALDQIYNSGLLPASTWNGWSPSNGLTEGTYGGWGGNPSAQVPFVRFDDTTIMSVPSLNGGNGAIADPLPPFSPTGQMGIWMSRAALDSDLLFIKTALFHELVHISELRDADGIYSELPNGTAVYNETRKKELFPVREVSASIRTIQFLQKLRKRIPPEFSELRIK